MIWITLSLTAVLLFTIGDLLDKFIATNEVKGPWLPTIIFGFLTFLAFTISSSLLQSILVDPDIVLLGLTAGLVTSAGVWFYFSALGKEEVSRAMPILGIVPLLVLPFGFLFFNESFTLLKYIGVGLVVLGSILISLKEKGRKFKFDTLLVSMFITAIMFAARNLLIKVSTQQLSIWPVLFWIGVGRGITSLTILIFYRSHLNKEMEKGVEHLALTGFIVALGGIFLFTAISLGPVSLVSALIGVKPMLVLLSATLITIVHPSFIREKVNTRILIHKTVATLMIIVGGTLVVL